MKPGTSTTTYEAKIFIDNHKPDIERYWRSLVRKLDDLRRKYTGELLAYGILDKGNYIKNSYVAAREFGCNIEEAQIFTTHYL